MLDQSVIAEWWRLLGTRERTLLLYHAESDMPASDQVILKNGCVLLATYDYAGCRCEVQEIIATAFLDGREADHYWFGILWQFECPSCHRSSREYGSVLFPSKNPQDIQAKASEQGAHCMNCNEIPPRGFVVNLRIFRAPLIVLRELGFANPDPDSPPTGKRFFDAWAKANSVD